MSEPLDIIGTSEAASICKVPHWQLQRWVKEGHLKAQATVNTRHLWERSVVECWAADSTDEKCEGRSLDIVGVDYIAERLGVQARTIHWRRNVSGTIPEPDAQVPSLLVWWKDRIDEWIDAELAVKAARA